MIITRRALVRDVANILLETWSNFNLRDLLEKCNECNISMFVWTRRSNQEVLTISLNCL